LIYLSGIEKIYYCVPGETMEVLDSRLGVEHIYQELSRPQSERTVPEIRILPGDVDENIGRYKVHYP
jgi:hypothetical protein